MLIFWPDRDTRDVTEAKSHLVGWQYRTDSLDTFCIATIIPWSFLEDEQILRDILQNYRSRSGDQPVHLGYLVQPGDPVSLPDQLVLINHGSVPTCR